MKLYVDRNIAEQRLNFSLYHRVGNNEVVALPLGPIAWRSVEYSDCKTPMLSLPAGVGQDLFQQLWDMGHRPVAGDGEVAAMRKHIRFAELIVWKLLTKAERRK